MYVRGDVAPMNKYVLHGQQGTQADRQAGRREHSRGVRRVLELLGGSGAIVYAGSVQSAHTAPPHTV